MQGQASTDDIRPWISRRRLIARVALAAIGRCLVTVALAAPATAEEPRPKFVVKLPAERQFAPCDARVFIFCSERPGLEPRLGPNWFGPEPFFAGDVKQLEPGREITIDDVADGFPERLSGLPAGRYFVQALVDRDQDHHHPGRAPGNWYSRVAEIQFNPRAELVATLDVMEEVPPDAPFPETDVVKELVLESRLLSHFHGRPVRQRGAVVLPASYATEPERRYPVLYIIPGFGGSYRSALAYQTGGPPAGAGETEFIRVVVEGDCKWGHHAFAARRASSRRSTTW